MVNSLILLITNQTKLIKHQTKIIKHQTAKLKLIYKQKIPVDLKKQVQKPKAAKIYYMKIKYKRNIF